jgi:hypothetical protein
MKNTIWRSTLIAALLITGCFQTYTQDRPEILWDKTIGGNFADRLGRIYPAPDGGWYLFGASSSSVGFEKSAPPRTLFGTDLWVMKYNANWEKEWDKVLGGTDEESLNGVIQTGDGGFILAATSYSDKSGDKSEDTRGTDDSDFWLIKIDAESNKVWDKTYGGADEDNVNGIRPHPSGGYLVAGTSYSGKSGDKTHDSYGKQDWWVIRIDDQGNLLWDKVYGGDRFDIGPGIFEDQDGFILTGYSDSSPSGNKTATKRGSYDAWLVKIDYEGNIIWDRAYGGSDNERAAGISRAHDGGYILSITSKSGISGDKTTADFGAEDAWFVKVDADWGTQWDKTIGTLYPDYLSAGRAGDGGYILSGRHVIEQSQPGGGVIEYGQRWLMHTDTLLNMDWEFKFGGDENETSGPSWRLEDDTTRIIMGSGSDSDISGDKSEDSRGGMDYWLALIQMPFGLYTGNAPIEQGSHVTIFPNPASGDQIYITSDNNPISEVSIFSLTGSRIKTIGYISEKRVPVPIGDLSPGVYISRIRTISGETIIQKLIKQ